MTGHGSMQADIVLEKELRGTHLDPQAEGQTMCHVGHNLSIQDLKEHLQIDTLPPMRPRLLQQGHTS